MLGAMSRFMVELGMLLFRAPILVCWGLVIRLTDDNRRDLERGSKTVAQIPREALATA